ncbi:hypothetical protein HDU97_003761 [Phlyctochytrium planicorne]|nr:hypothetical protein HDU97_003761 [Phlyctochytrium planicorne]
MKLPAITGLIMAVAAFSSLAVATEGIYMVDCDYTELDVQGNNHFFQQSHMIYYPNVNDIRQNVVPPSKFIANIEPRHPQDGAGLVNWEAWEDLPDNSQEDFVVAKFSNFGDGNHVKAYINKQAKTWPRNTVVGNAVNDQGKWFTCRKDIGWVLYFQELSGYTEKCFVKYYCFA